LGVWADRLAVFGESAGDNLAAVVALMARDASAPRLRRQILVYPAVDARMQAASLYEFDEGFLQTRRDVEYAFRTYALAAGIDPLDWRLSPLHASSHAGLAPAFILSAELDAMRDDSTAYTERLLDQGVAATHVQYEGMIHTFYSMRGVVDAAEVAQIQTAREIIRAFAE
jgi:acetyl esterase